MWSGGLPAGFCDRAAYGHRPPCEEYRTASGEVRRRDFKYNGYIPGLACPAHGGPETVDIDTLRLKQDAHRYCPDEDGRCQRGMDDDEEGQAVVGIRFARSLERRLTEAIRDEKKWREEYVARCVQLVGAGYKSFGYLEEAITRLIADRDAATSALTLAREAAEKAEKDNAQLRRLLDRGTPISEYERRQSERAGRAEEMLVAAERERDEARKQYAELVEIHRGWCNYCKGDEAACLSAPPHGCTIATHARAALQQSGGNDE